MLFLAIGVSAEGGPCAGGVGLFDFGRPCARARVPGEGVFEGSVGILPSEYDGVALLFAIAEGFGHGSGEDVHPMDGVALGFLFEGDVDVGLVPAGAVQVLHHDAQVPVLDDPFDDGFVFGGSVWELAVDVPVADEVIEKGVLEALAGFRSHIGILDWERGL